VISGYTFLAVVPLALCVMVAGCEKAPGVQGGYGLAADLDEWARASEELVAAARVGHQTIRSELAADPDMADPRLDEPPMIWRVPEALVQFSDCVECPQMVVVPAGEFTMGSPSRERYRGPEAQHRVLIDYPFAVSKYEVTFNEWEACVTDGGCGDFPLFDEGWGRDDRPIINVSWEDAQIYVEWLSKKTGARYRLLSEAEWEYAARAGTTTAFHFGETLSGEQANIDGSPVFGEPPSPVNRQMTRPVGQFSANAFGLHDMHGNVWEWVEDCWNDEYTGAPTDGGAWLTGSCGGRVLRGGSWREYLGDARSAARVASDSDDLSYTDGIRIARDL
jgi:formylglycine-generating enzyme required for sulfatase activity